MVRGDGLSPGPDGSEFETLLHRKCQVPNPPSLLVKDVDLKHFGGRRGRRDE